MIHQERSGFTLLELLLVASILVLLAGMMLPRMTRSYRILEMRGALHDLASTIDRASESAVRGRHRMRLAFEQGANAYWVEEDDLESPIESFTEVRAGVLASLRHLPKGMKIEAEDDPDEEIIREETRGIGFEPDGSRRSAVLKLTDRTGRERWIIIGRHIGATEVVTERPDEADWP